MDIVCIALAPAKPGHSRGDVLGKELLILMAGIIETLINAGHKVNWIEPPLCQSSVEEAIKRVSVLDPDVVLFACNGYPGMPLMASMAVRCEGSRDGEYICDDILRPAQQWCDTLSNPDMSLPLLIEKIKQYYGASAACTAMNDAFVASSATPV